MTREINEPNASASDRQTFAIFAASKVDIRKNPVFIEIGLTRQQASDLIVLLNTLEGKSNPKETINRFMDSLRTGEKVVLNLKTTLGESATIIRQPKYASIMNEARAAANKAGDEWVAAHTEPQFAVLDKHNRPIATMLDVCGMSWIVMTDKRTAFAKWIKNVYYKNSRFAGSDFIHLNHKYIDRQELGLREACSRAAIDVFIKHGITCVRHESRID